MSSPGQVAKAVEAASEEELRGLLSELSSPARARLATMLAPPAVAPRYEKKRLALGPERGNKEMAYVDTGGPGPTIVFVHGSPTSSYMWRNVMPRCEKLGARLVALDLIGMGDSDKLDKEEDGDSPPGSRYSVSKQYAFLNAFLEKLGLHETPKKVIIVGHSWGALLGTLWAKRHAEAMLGVVFMECTFTPFSSATMPPMLKGFVEQVRTEKGEAMILHGNMMIEHGLQMGTMRALDGGELDHYRKPFVEPGESRRPMLEFARSITVDGEPLEVVQLIEESRVWLESTDDLPKLLICGNPGSTMTPEEKSIVMSWPCVTDVTVRGKHQICEDSPDEVGMAIAKWYTAL